jgi:pimeloyl-ACP methyl ester carboxylesterase
MKRKSVGCLCISVLLAYLNVITAAHADLSTGLVAYYPFNGNANDASGNGNNGIVVGATFATDTPNNRTGLLCNGTSATYVVVPRSTSLEPTDAISISLWCKGVPGAANTYGTILRKAGNLQPGYFLRKVLHDDVDVTPTFLIDSGGDSYCAFSPSDGTSWRLFVATYSRTDGLMRTYVNGVEINSTALSQQLQHSGDLFIGGATVHPQDGGFNGLIDDVRIYNRALSAAEIQQLAGNQSVCHSVPGNASGGVSFGNVVAGQTYTYSYSASGCIYMGGPSWSSTDADGNLYTNCTTFVQKMDPALAKICDGLTTFSLVGKIAGSQCVQLGKSGSFVAPASGELTLYYNDDIFGDNIGSFEVCITPASAIVLCDDFSTDSTASYHAIYWPYDGASATTSILYDAPNQRAIVQGVGGYGMIVMERNAESPIPAGSDFTFSADVSILSEFNGYLYLGDNRPIPPRGGVGTGLRFNIGTFMGYNCDFEVWQNGVSVAHSRQTYTPQNPNHLKITRVNNEYSFYVNNNLVWKQAIPTLNGMALYYGVGNEISSGPSGITAQTAVDNICVTSTGAPRRPVIVLPGIMGSRLCASGHNCGLTGWPADALNSGVGDPQNLQFTQNGEPVDGISNDLEPAEILDMFGPFHVYHLDELVEFLETNGYERDSTLFEFPYDFRRRISYLSDKLAETIDEVRSFTGADKVDIVAHSLGGLVAKEYIKDREANSHVDTLIMLGTPHTGTPKGLAVLRYGDNGQASVGDAFLNECKLKRAGHNWPSAFSLLPSRRYLNDAGRYFDDETVADGNTNRGLLDFDGMVTDLTTSLDHSSCLMQAADPEPRLTLSASLVSDDLVDFHDTLDGWSPPADVKVYMIAGYNKKTITKITDQTRLDSSQLCSVLYEFSSDGDGTVALKSAEAINADQKYYADLRRLGGDHGAIMSPSPIRQLVLNLLQGLTDTTSPYISTSRPTTFSRSTTLVTCSPVRLGVYDSLGNHTGVLPDGTIETEIPESSVEKVDHQQFVVVPEGDGYQVVIEGLENGSFTLMQIDAESDGHPIKSFLWLAVPVANGSQDTMVTAFGAVNPALNVDTNGDGVTDYSLPPDADGDRVPDTIDNCPGTPLGSVVNANGCSIYQLVPCDGPRSGGTWKSHGQYVRAVVQAATDFLRGKLITRKQWVEIVTRAAWSKCGWNRRCDHDWDWDWHRNWDCDHDRDWGRSRDWDR